VVPLGVDMEFFRPASADAIETVRRRYAIDGPFLLSLGGIEPRKNLPALIRAYASLPEDVRPILVIAGPVAPWNPEGWDLVRPSLEALPPRVRDRVVVTGYVSEEEKVALLGGAEALVYPSLYEGFGLPVIEAMACGTPVLTSNVSALPDTAGDAALLVDPRSPEDIADAMERLLTDDTLGERLRTAGTARAAGFSWDETARLTADVLRRASG
jgi:glycosyltransferase involved in cell wall biosynthesis